MGVRDWKLRHLRTHQWLTVAAVVAGALVLPALPTHPQTINCLGTGQPLPKVPEIVSSPTDKKLVGTMLLADQQQRIAFTTYCAPQYVRFFQSGEAIPTPPAGTFPDPMPGPTLRARVGDIIQLTFLNQVNPGHYGASLDKGDQGACDQTSGGYPASFNDQFPNCFHGSSTGNIHFHGTHTNPNSTGDNVFLQVRPSPRQNDRPVVTGASVKPSFDKFFADCEAQLRRNPISEFPYLWSDLPTSWTTDQQEVLLKAYDAGTTPYSPPPKPAAQKLWPANQKSIDAKQWPQYYVGAYPYCFQLPEYKWATWPPPPGAVPNMGQAPGLHWYHAHKHGSTATNVLNGMTGAFVIEGLYDDELNTFYGRQWTRTQPVMVINQIGVTPNAVGGAGVPGGGPSFSVNGRLQPKVSMKPGEVQMWRIVNTSSRSGVFFAGFQTSGGQSAGFAWKQLAQDGVQFADPNYRKSQNPTFTMAAGNRVDLLVRAPATAQTYNVMAQSTVAEASLATPALVTLMTVEVSGTPATGPQSQFIPRAPTFPAFLTDITDAEVRNTPKRTLTFNSLAPQAPVQHTINGQQFSNNFIVPVTLGPAEEWRIENTTTPQTGPGYIDHPFHIHINPFQIVEVFDPNETVQVPGGTTTVPKYVLTPAALQYPQVQCSLNPDKKDTWRDCHNTKQRYGIWWDVFAIPSGRQVTQSNNDTTVVPGYFRMRSRFVDFPGNYVLHCHILAHEDRGMMAIVSVSPVTPPPSHH